uniref:Uncharacterized protein n=1 Tax=viral metagenome TaxID=1070528 RepID=A0A6C0JUD5_9ZZZZ
MKLYKWLYIVHVCVYALNPSHFPNGKKKTYVSRTPPHEDLVLINPSKSSFVSKHWLANIINTMTTRDKRYYNEHPDLHIINRINQLEHYIQENRKQNDYYLAWMPKCKYGSKDVLFLIVCQTTNTGFYVKHVIPSPYWSPDQIGSCELKRALESLNSSIDFTVLYDTDMRYKLAWSTWNILNSMHS